MNPYLQCRGNLIGHFYFMERDFKGVWIPKEVWLDENLTWMEKLKRTRYSEYRRGVFGKGEG